jgi:hypothetical protein
VTLRDLYPKTQTGFAETWGLVLRTLRNRLASTRRATGVEDGPAVSPRRARSNLLVERNIFVDFTNLMVLSGFKPAASRLCPTQLCEPLVQELIGVPSPPR